MENRLCSSPVSAGEYGEGAPSIVSIGVGEPCRDISLSASDCVQYCVGGDFAGGGQVPSLSFFDVSLETISSEGEGTLGLDTYDSSFELAAFDSASFLAC